MDFGLRVYPWGVLPLELQNCTEGGTEPVARIQYVELAEHFRQHRPVLLRAGFKGVGYFSVVLSEAGGRLEKAYVEVSVCRTQIVSPYLNSKHKHSIRWRIDKAESRIRIPDGIVCIIYGGSIQSLQDHAGESDDDGDYD